MTSNTTFTERSCLFSRSTNNEACSYATGFVWAMLAVCLIGPGVICRIGIIVILFLCTNNIMEVMHFWLTNDVVNHFEEWYAVPLTLFLVGFQVFALIYWTSLATTLVTIVSVFSIVLACRDYIPFATDPSQDLQSITVKIAGVVVILLGVWGASVLVKLCVGSKYLNRMKQAFTQATLASFAVWMCFINIYNARDHHKDFVDDMKSFARPETSAAFLVTLFAFFQYLKAYPGRILLVYNPTDNKSRSRFDHFCLWIKGDTDEITDESTDKHTESKCAESACRHHHQQHTSQHCQAPRCREHNILLSNSHHEESAPILSSVSSSTHSRSSNNGITTAIVSSSSIIDNHASTCSVNDASVRNGAARKPA